MLYLAGYLTTDDTALPNDGRRLRPLRIPNEEVATLYRGEIVDRFSEVVGSRERLAELHRALVEGDAATLADELEGILLKSASYFDLTAERDYHMLMLGLVFGMPGYGDPLSNREAGRGRFDIRLEPCEGSYPAVILELKCRPGGAAGKEELAQLAEGALAQIGKKLYDADLPPDRPVRKFDIAFSGKSVAVAAGPSIP